MIGNPSHIPGSPTADTQLGINGSGPQVEGVKVSIVEHLVIDGQVVIPGTSPHISNIRLALDDVLKPPENF